MAAFETVYHDVDLCVVGGGLSGICAAIAAARHGSRVAIIQDRPVFGGNASSEVRMWVSGAHGLNRRETGIIEEIELENACRNPNRVYSIWDTILWGKVTAEANITAILNCSVCQAETSDGSQTVDGSILSVTGWQTTTQRWHAVRARFFADCSGDSILAPLCGADYRVGREAREEFGESIAPEIADRRTMGMSCLIQARELDHEVEFVPPSWARYYEHPEDLPYRSIDPFTTNYWWVELGGEHDSIGDTETIRDRLLAEAFGVWDLIKNRSGIKGVQNLELDFVGFLPGKRESRRYVGDHTVTQGDVTAGGPFEDVVAYGGWSMDDHHPAGIDYPGEPTVFHPAPSPWGIPYRSLYSLNVPNLFFAGRNISTTHAALSSCRVMRTCAIIGQAVGTAAALCVRHNVGPRDFRVRVNELQQALMGDDCWLPGHRRELSAAVRTGQWSSATGDASALGNGVDRPVEMHEEDTIRAANWTRRGIETNAATAEDTDPSGDRGTADPIEWVENAWRAPIGSSATLEFDRARTVSSVRIVFDSDLNRHYREVRMRASYFRSDTPVPVASQLVKRFRIDARVGTAWKPILEENGNHQRLYRARMNPVETSAVRVTTLESWGAAVVSVFGFDVY